MKDEFTNRLDMFGTALGILQKPAYRPVWFERPPVIFTAKVAAVTTLVNDLTEFCRQQGILASGPAADKEREGLKVEEGAFTLARVLSSYFGDKENETDRAKVKFSKTNWRRLRDADLLARARTVQGLAAALAAGPDKLLAAQYNITVAAAADLQGHITRYAPLATAPQQSIGDRASLTAQLRQRFNAVSVKFADLDDVILQFNATPEGRALVSAWQQARVIIDRGHGGGGEDAGGGEKPTA